MDKSLLTLSLVLVLAAFLSSCTGNSCNKLEFVDSFDNVQHNVIALDSILRISSSKCHSQYDIIFTQDSLLVRDRNNGFEYNQKSFCDSSRVNNLEFARIAAVMRKNHISFVVKGDGGYMYYFNQCNPNDDFDYIRYLVINRKGVRVKLSSQYKVLDAQKSLILVAPRSIPSYYHPNQE